MWLASGLSPVSSSSLWSSSARLYLAGSSLLWHSFTCGAPLCSYGLSAHHICAVLRLFRGQFYCSELLGRFDGRGASFSLWKLYFYLEDLLLCLGLHESVTKAVPPVQKVTCLGVEVNTLDMTISVDSSRLAALQSLLQLQSLIGHLMFMSKCMRQSRIFVSRILELLQPLKAPHHRLRLKSEFKKDLHWWLSLLPLYNRVSLIPTSPWTSPDAVFSMDTCLSGCGGISFMTFFQSPFPDSMRVVVQSITYSFWL